MKILIAGLPKTGTTGLLYLIASSRATEPRLLFEPRVCPPAIDAASQNVIAKVLIRPDLNAASFAHFDKKITLVRDPRDRLVSALLYSQFHATYLADDEKVRSVRECLEKKETKPSSISISELVEVLAQANGRPGNHHPDRIKESLALFDDYVASVPDGFLYKYEDFVSGNYRPLEVFLGFPITGAAEVPDTLSRVERTRAFGDWRNWFTADDLRRFPQVLSPWLETYGYDATDWSLNTTPFIDPEHCSRYFMRLVDESRTKAAKNRPSAAKTRTGRVMRAEVQLVTGWAVGADPQLPVRLALCVNGTEVAQTVADRPRDGLRERGVHPTGMCGFRFGFEEHQLLRIGDQVAVTPVGENFRLKNSPRIVAAAPSHEAD